MCRPMRARTHTGRGSCALSLFLLPVLQWLGTGRDTFQIRIDAVRARRAGGFLRRHFLTLGLFFCAAFLALAFALALLLRWP